MARPYCPTYGNVERVLYSAEATHARGLEQFARSILADLPMSRTQRIFTTLQTM